jgi:hypothetical protein
MSVLQGGFSLHTYLISGGPFYYTAIFLQLHLLSLGFAYESLDLVLGCFFGFMGGLLLSFASTLFHSFFHVLV